MAFVAETYTIWEPGIYQWEITDPIEGGVSGIDNTPTRQLAKRTKYLYDKVAALEASEAEQFFYAIAF